LVAACGGVTRTLEPIQYDLGDLSGKWSGSRVPIAAVDVQAASWLAGQDMHFRLAYQEPLRRQSYVESRWVAPPSELLERFLRRRIVFGQSGQSGAGCRLQLVLDELEQRFDDPRSSKIVLEVRAQLSPSRSPEILSRQAFLIQRPAPEAVARGGVAAARDAAQGLVTELGNWLGRLVDDKPALVERCRN
ncbi:MAG: ABC-type transport auxiliary lipoprotein family protein, partial [Sulfuritalea sp.]|nr:ABC-type transport auxiliary lipoprotein family protein [Sulfuritalea sp.]